MAVTYDLKKTNQLKPAITVDENTKITNLVDIVLFGYKKLEYGRELNENILHILENFACPEDTLNPGNPDTSRANYGKLTDARLIEGQFWYNTTQSIINFWDGTQWIPLSNFGEEIAANWGQILHGEQLPRPESASGYLFPYSECSWIVSPFNQIDIMGNMVCRTDDVATVEMTYTYDGDVVLTNGIANYLIVGIKDNSNVGTQLPVPPILPSLTPTPTPGASLTPTPTPSPSSGSIVNPSPTPTPTPVYQPLGLTINSSPIQASCTAASSCTASRTVNSFDYTIVGGSGNFSYQWSFVSGESFSFGSTTTAFPILSRNRTVSALPYDGTGRLRVTDNTTGSIVERLFTFRSIHTSVALSPTPTPTQTPTPTPTPTPSRSAVAPSLTPTPTPTPSRSAIAPLVLSESGTGCNYSAGLSGFDCSSSGGSPTFVNVVDSASYNPMAEVSISGGIGPYTNQIIAAVAGPASQQVVSITASTAGTVSFAVQGTAGSIESPLIVSVSGTFTVRITDAIGQTATVDITCTSTHGYYCTNILIE